MNEEIDINTLKNPVFYVSVSIVDRHKVKVRQNINECLFFNWHLCVSSIDTDNVDKKKIDGNDCCT